MQPDVILLDIHLPGVTGIDAIAALGAAAPAARALMLTVSEDAQDLAAALRAGARGYLLKTADSEQLAAAIVRTVHGESTISPEMSGKLADAFRAQGGTPQVPEAAAGPDAVETLSPREREILAQLARGASNKEIARKLGIAETTVKIHVQHILRKLGSPRACWRRCWRRCWRPSGGWRGDAGAIAGRCGALRCCSERLIGRAVGAHGLLSGDSIP